MATFFGRPLQPPPASAGRSLDRSLCQVVGLNQNYTSKTRTSYHIQIEDRGPIPDEAAGRDVRRVNVIIYANYGEPNARIIFGRNHDFEDVRTHEHNRFVAGQISTLAAKARGIIEDHEQREIERIKGLVREYQRSRTTATRKDIAAANAASPFLFSRAWVDLRTEQPQGADPAPNHAPEPTLDAMVREQIGEIEQVIAQLGEDLERLAAQGGTDDILLLTCHRLVARAKSVIVENTASGFKSRRLDATRSVLLKTWRLVRSRVRP